MGQGAWEESDAVDVFADGALGGAGVEEFGEVGSALGAVREAVLWESMIRELVKVFEKLLLVVLI